MNKKKIVKIVFIALALIIVAVLAFFLVKSITANSNVERIANEKGEKYGITDFESKSSFHRGSIHMVKLYSDSFYTLSNEDKLNLIASISTNEEMISLLDPFYQEFDNPLAGQLLEVFSNDLSHCVVVNDDRNSLELHCGEERYYFDDATSYGYSLGEFSNAYGTEDTVCAHRGCDNTIARSGDTNCCATHSNRCGECYKYIDEDAMWCMSCIESAIG